MGPDLGGLDEIGGFLRSYRVKQICVKLMLDNVGAAPETPLPLRVVIAQQQLHYFCGSCPTGTLALQS
jgi:hypothetical protein